MHSFFPSSLGRSFASGLLPSATHRDVQRLKLHKFTLGPFGTKKNPPQGHRDERYLKHFDLAAGGVQVLHILSALILFEGVDLDAERYALLSAMLPRCELCAYAVHLTTTTTNTQLHHDPEQLYRLYNKGHKQCVCVCAHYISPVRIQTHVWKHPTETQQH